MSEHEERQLLADHVLGRLLPAESDLITAHLAECAECADWVETYEFFREALGSPGSSSPEAHPSSEALSHLLCSPDRLAEEDLASLERHLSWCPECRPAVEVTREALSASRQTSLPHRSGWPRFARPYSRRWPMALAAALLIVVVGLSVRTLIDGTTDRSDNLVFSDDVRGHAVVEARESIIASEARVQSGADVTFRAGELVVLGDGFTVEPGATFAVEVGQPHSSRDPASDG